MNIQGFTIEASLYPNPEPYKGTVAVDGLSER